MCCRHWQPFIRVWPVAPVPHPQELARIVHVLHEQVDHEEQVEDHDAVDEAPKGGVGAHHGRRGALHHRVACGRWGGGVGSRVGLIRRGQGALWWGSGALRRRAVCGRWGWGRRGGGARTEHATTPGRHYTTTNHYIHPPNKQHVPLSYGLASSPRNTRMMAQMPVLAFR